MNDALESFLGGRWLKHPLHAVLVHMPMGLWPAALIFDLLTRWGAGSQPLVRLSFYCIAAGLGGAALAAPAGWVDWSRIKPDKPARQLGRSHLRLNLLASLLFLINLVLRLPHFRDATTIGNLPLALSVMGVLLVLIGGSLGARMVFDEGTSVARFSKDQWRGVAEQSGSRVPLPKEGHPS